MTTVVTGASGHVGATLVRRLLDEGRSVRALDMAPGLGLQGLDVELRQGDIRDRDFLAAAIEPGDTVFHLASVISTTGDKGGLVSSVNIEGARGVAETCLQRGAKKLVHFSSVHAYDIDTHGTPVTEKTRPATANSRSAYNCSKAKGQAAVLEVADRGLDATVVNPCGIIGPYDYKASRMGKFFRAIARMDKPPRPGPSGFNWVDVRDVVDGALAAETRGRPGHAYILSGHWVSNLDLSRMAAELLGKPGPDKAISLGFVKFMLRLGPVLQLLGQRPPVTQEAVDALLANPDIRHDKASAELGYQPRPIEQTVADILAWLADEGVLEREKAERDARRKAS